MLLYSFIGCICPEGWTGDHCETPVETASTEDLLHYATSKTNVARVVGFLILAVFGGTAILFCIDQQKTKKLRKMRRDEIKRSGGSSYRHRNQNPAGEMA